jgi:hypothetical protein
MKKIKIIQYRKEPCGSTLGAYLYSYDIDFNGNWSYDCTMTQEGMSYLEAALKKGNEVEFVKLWEQKEVAA